MESESDPEIGIEFELDEAGRGGRYEAYFILIRISLSSLGPTARAKRLRDSRSALVD